MAPRQCVADENSEKPIVSNVVGSWAYGGVGSRVGMIGIWWGFVGWKRGGWGSRIGLTWLWLGNVKWSVRPALAMAVVT